jgi:hypothetical protein
MNIVYLYEYRGIHPIRTLKKRQKRLAAIDNQNLINHMGIAEMLKKWSNNEGDKK